MKMEMQQRRQSGFTLIEVMVVVVILGILAAFIVPRLMDRPDAARVAKAKSDIRSIESALSLYRLDNHSYPATDEGLDALVEKPADAPAWKEGGYLDRLPKDPWGKPYQYLNPGVHGTIDIFTYGADGAEGGDGANADVGNWSIE
jgi:general secretion pathway protein G